MTTPQTPLTNRLKRIQARLGIEADGVLGPETLSALERKLGIVVPERAMTKTLQRAVSLQCSRASLDLLVGFEVGSRQRYEREYQQPVWPGGQSGVTIGIGYDLGMTDKARIREDWSPLLTEAEVMALIAVQGVVGPDAKALVRGISHVRIPYEAAAQVFFTRTLPLFAALTRQAFPGVQKLPADAQGMLLSLVYNRGASTSGARRREMANLQRLMRASRLSLPALAAEFESMKRLWPELPGLQSRRQREGDVIRASKRRYQPAEIIKV